MATAAPRMMKAIALDAFGGIGITALRGLEDVLKLSAGESILGQAAGSDTSRCNSPMPPMRIALHGII